MPPFFHQDTSYLYKCTRHYIVTFNLLTNHIYFVRVCICMYVRKVEFLYSFHRELTSLQDGGKHVPHSCSYFVVLMNPISFNAVFCGYTQCCKYHVKIFTSLALSWLVFNLKNTLNLHQVSVCTIDRPKPKGRWSAQITTLLERTKNNIFPHTRNGKPPSRLQTLHYVKRSGCHVMDLR